MACPPASRCSTRMATTPHRPGSEVWSPSCERRCSTTRWARSRGSRPSPRRPASRPEPSPACGRPTTSRTPATRPGPSPRPSWPSPSSPTPTARGWRRCCTPWWAPSPRRWATPRRPCGTHGSAAGARPARCRRRRGPDPRTPRRARHVGGASRRGRGVDGRDRAHPGTARATSAGRRWPPPGPRWRSPAATSPRGSTSTGPRSRSCGPSGSRGWATPTGSSRGRCSARAWASPPWPCTAPVLETWPTAGASIARCSTRRRWCSTRGARSWTTPSPVWCCTGSAPGACCATRCLPRPPCTCSCSPSGSATPGSPRPCARSAPPRRPRSTRPGWRSGCAPSTPAAPPPACCPKPEPWSLGAPLSRARARRHILRE